MLIIEIALGIVVAVVILHFLPTILALGLVLVVLGVVLVVAGGVIALVIAYPEPMLTFLAIGAVCFGYVYWDNQREAKRKIAESARLGYGTAGVSAREQSNASVLSHSITQTIGFIAKYKQRFTFGAAAFVILGTLGAWYYVEPGFVPYLIGLYGVTALIAALVFYCRKFYEAGPQKAGIDNGIDQKDGEPQMLVPSGVHDDDRPH
jgi:membrane protein implicated in regulation of membrane protease activity